MEVELTGWIRQVVLTLLPVEAEGVLHQGVAVELWVGGHVDLEGLPGEVVVAV